MLSRFMRKNNYLQRHRESMLTTGAEHAFAVILHSPLLPSRSAKAWHPPPGVLPWRVTAKLAFMNRLQLIKPVDQVFQAVLLAVDHDCFFVALHLVHQEHQHQA